MLHMCKRILLPTVLATLAISLPMVILAAEGTTVTGIENPLNSGSLTELLRDILNIAVDIGIPVVTIMIIMAGFKYVTAGGDRGKVEDAHSMFLWTVVGAAIVLGAFVIANIIETTVNAIRG